MNSPTPPSGILLVYADVAYLLSDEATRKREFGNLEAVSDNYPKYVVSLDEWTSGSTVIKHIHLGEFLSEDSH